MLRNVLLLITGTKRECTTKTFLVYDENGEKNVVLLSVTLLHYTNTCLRDGMLTFWLFKVPTIKTTDNVRSMIP